MKVYIVWYNQKWGRPELQDVFEREEDAEKQAGFLNSRVGVPEKEHLQSHFYVDSHEVQSSEQTVKEGVNI